jgi:hypothetical protein
MINHFAEFLRHIEIIIADRQLAQYKITNIADGLI